MFGSAAVNHGPAVREMVQFWFSQNWSKLGQSIWSTSSQRLGSGFRTQQLRVNCFG
ncbi:hypothetical protein HanPSC8_Chr04g0151711 [Helianthus annuus]|nr:hypothetical protein HanPSC8_Chr04g0151711 [Helianthus annuus]